MKVKNICCIGAGYVGGPTMSVIALKCPQINITLVDSDLKKIEAWNGPIDKLPVFEPGLSDIVRSVRGKNLFFSSDIKGAIEKSEMIFMAVNTPTKKEGKGAGRAADLSNIEACARDISKYSKSDKIVVEKSTLPVRTAEKIKEILIQNKKGIKFDILSNPEFLAEGTAIKDLFKSDRVLIGGDESESGKKAIKLLIDIYSNWIKKEKILTTNVWSAELAKLASNAMLAQRISSINSLSALCEKSGADVTELSKAIGMDHRIGKHFLNASVAFGGSCFKKDILNLVYLCKYYKLDDVAEYWLQVVKINEYQKHRFTEKIISNLNNDIKNQNIAILGWSFKPNTNDSRESPSIYVTYKLLEKGAMIKVFDPLIRLNQIKNDLRNFMLSKSLSSKKTEILLNNISFSELKEMSFNSFSSIAILTACPEFKEIEKDLIKSKANIYDGCNLFNSKQFTYTIGK